MAGFDVVASALNRGDTDEQVARALGAPMVRLAPFGAIEPLAPAEDVIVYEIELKLAEMVCVVVTFVNVNDATGPTDEPSTTTSAIVWQASGVIVKVWFDPSETGTTPLGLIAPPAPALAVIFHAWISATW